MHGLVNRSIEIFLKETYGEPLWREVARAANVDVAGFETMLVYPDASTLALIAAASAQLDRAEAAFLEDLGAFLVTREPLRRLLRFGGGDFHEFLLSLDELQARGQMALPDLELPDLVIEQEGRARYFISVQSGFRGWGAVMSGLLRAMADDYGALVLIDPAGPETVSVELLEAQFVAGRRFDLAQPEMVSG